ncbi:MAG: pheT, partial [Chloroflexi bacterium]|nr:pheT [Chloroflexota bacterium]
LGLSDDHDGILILDRTILSSEVPSQVRVGTPLSEFVGEWVLELEITPNRPDCLSVYGMAREVAAITGATLQPFPQPAIAPFTRSAHGVTLAIEDPDLCSRISAVVIEGIAVGDSPKWLVDRLQGAGMRSINNIVDVTNYVMLELGQPLHAYDMDKLKGPSLRARRARPGERITTLDGVERELTTDTLLITDDERPVGIAGVMGGLDTEVSADTRNILLEAATFNGRNIRRTSVALGLRSEASSRFEKGLPVQLAPKAARRAAALIADLSCGEVASDVLVTGMPDPEPRVIPFGFVEVGRLLGVDWSAEHISAKLEALGFTVNGLVAGEIAVIVPWWRNDVAEGADLVEEAARITGYDAIPETLLRGSVEPRPISPGQQQYSAARAVLLASGLNEGSSPALTSLRSLETLRPQGLEEPWLSYVVPHASFIAEAGSNFEPVRVVNPLTPEREILRPMLLPGLLEALRDNLRAGEDRAAFFELDSCAFARPGNLPVERRSLSIAMAGERCERSWAVPPAAADFFDLKGIVEVLIERLGVKDAKIVSGSNSLVHPGRSAALEVDGVNVGFFGELHPQIAEAWDLGNRRAYVAEFDFDAIAAKCSDERAFAEFSRQPLAKRDLAIVVDESQAAALVLEEVRRAAKGLLARVRLIDVYRGDQIPLGKKSLACSLDFQAPDRTLTEDEVEKLIYKIRRTLEHRVGATFRA